MKERAVKKNFIVSYDVNRPNPTHAQVDEHIKKLKCVRARILETVWYIQADTTVDWLTRYIGQVLTQNDRLMVVEGAGAMFQNMLVDDAALVNTWNSKLAA